MHKKAAYCLIYSVLLVGAAQSQESQDSLTGEAVTEVVAEEAERPDMPIIFFTKEQRRVLEAVRQGVVSANSFQDESFVPLVVIEETFSAEDLEAENRERERFRIDAVVRNRSKDSGFVWMNGRLVDIEKDKDLLEDNGFVLGEEEKPIGDDYVFRGMDTYGNSKFEIKVGQFVNEDGYVDEGLPVIVRHKK